MSTPGRPARLELGNIIKKLREATIVDGRSMTQAQLGRIIGKSQGTVAKIESGAIPAQPAIVETIVVELPVAAELAARMRELASFGRVGVPWSGERTKVPQHAREFMTDEQDARELLSWHENRIPGALQSRQFALQQFEADGRADVFPYLYNREQRTMLFRRPNLERYVCVLTENMFRVGGHRWGRDVIRDEIDHLLSLNDPERRPPGMTAEISIRVLPNTAPILHQPPDFVIVHLPNSERSYVYVEHVCGADYHRKSEELKQTTQAWEELLYHSLDPGQTSELLTELRASFANG